MAHLPTVAGARLTDFYGVPRYGDTHRGIDVAGIAPGTTPPVYAVLPGRVVLCDRYALPARNGRYIVVQHIDGTYAAYGHCIAPLVREGDWVDEGQQLATMGRDGLSASAGIHLHLEYWTGWLADADPLDWLADLGIRFDGTARYSRLKAPTIRPAATKLEEIMSKLDQDDRDWLRAMVREETAAAATAAVEAVQSAPLYDRDDPNRKAGPTWTRTEVMVRQLRDAALPHLAHGGERG